MLDVIKKSNIMDNGIIEDFISCCSNSKKNQLIKLLNNKSIVTNMPNKLRFFTFLSYMIDCMSTSSVGKITPKWEQIKWMKKERKCLRFYDEHHKFPRLTIIVEKKNEKIYFETIPF